MLLGIDVSTYLEENNAKARYFDGEKEVNPLLLARNNGVNLIRLRVWNNPYTLDGIPYLGGTNNIDNDLEIIKDSIGLGYQYIIDFHYSDFWCDPSKQFLPKAWKDLSLEELKEAVYSFTKETLIKLKENNVPVPYIQIGNEITNGFLWPIGKLDDNGERMRGNYSSFTSLLKMGIKGAREVYPKSKIIIHLERSNDYKVYEELFTELEKEHVDYDIIGMSYYAYWHGTMDQLFFNIHNCREKFHHNVMICELGYGFTLEDYILTSNGHSELKVTRENLEADLEYEISIDGQAAFIEAFIKRANDEDLEGVVYWEPFWIPGDSICWASVEGQAYIHEEGHPTRNEWSNQCLFDYTGHKLPGFDKFKI